MQSSEVLRKTGTDDVCHLFATPVMANEGERGQMFGVDNAADADSINEAGRNPHDLLGVGADCGSLMADEGIAPSRTRTLNLVIKSHLLCQLS
jgi:hypothetical protein